MLLNAALVEKISKLLVKSLDNTKEGSYVLEHNLGDELRIEFVRNDYDSHWVVNNFYLSGSTLSLASKENVNKVIGILLIKMAIIKADEEEKILDMFNGITSNISYESIIGLTVKFHCDVDSRRLMVTQTANPNNVLYALEEAVNPEMSIDPQLMTPSIDLRERTTALFGDYLLADLITHDVAI